MLAIRMQRTGRSGHAMFRVVVQDARRTPTSGKIVAQIGSYDPHAKTVQISKDKASFYLEHGAQPSDRVARLLKSEGVKLPKWVSPAEKKTGAIRNPDKLRRNRPVGAAAPAAKAPDTETAVETAETPDEAVAETTEPTATEATQAQTEAPTASETEAESEAASEPEIVTKAPDEPESASAKIEKSEPEQS